MVDPLSIPNVDPYPNWPSTQRQRQGKDSAKRRKTKADRQETTEVSEEETTDSSNQDSKPSSDDYLGTQIDLEV